MTALVVLGEAHVCRGGRVTKLVFMVVCRGGCERGSLETSKLEILEENYGLASVSRRGLNC